MHEIQCATFCLLISKIKCVCRGYGSVFDIHSWSLMKVVIYYYYFFSEIGNMLSGSTERKGKKKMMIGRNEEYIKERKKNERNINTIKTD